MKTKLLFISILIIFIFTTNTYGKDGHIRRIGEGYTGNRTYTALEPSITKYELMEKHQAVMEAFRPKQIQSSQNKSVTNCTGRTYVEIDTPKPTEEPKENKENKKLTEELVNQLKEVKNLQKELDELLQ